MASLAKQTIKPETYVTDSGQTMKAAEAMAKGGQTDHRLRATYSRMIVDEGRSFGDYITNRIASTFKKAG